jgi:hypothetical protein
MELVWATNLMVSHLQALKTWQFEGSFEEEEGVGQKPRGLCTASVQALKEGVQEDGELEPQARWSVTSDYTLMYESTT